LPDFSSGTEILALHSAVELRSRGHEVRILTAIPVAAGPQSGSRFDRYEYEGFSVTRFRHSHVPMGAQSNVAEQEYNNLLVAERFETLADEFRPDAVHFFHLMRLSASVVDVCLRRDIPTVLTPTDFWFICPMCQLRLPDGTICAGPDAVAANCLRHVVSLKGPQAVANILNRLPDRLVRGAVRLAALAPLKKVPPAALVTALSQRAEFLKSRLNRIGAVLLPTRIMRDTLLRHGLDPTRARSCSYGIRLPEPVRRRQGAAGRPLTVGVIGLGEHKGAHVLVQALRRLPQADLKVRIYGRQSDFPDYVQRLAELAGGDPRMEFSGTFANDRIGPLLSELDALVVPSVWFENAPLVIYAAQAVSCPVIGSDMPGISELITNGDNGLLFPPGDAGRLAEILQRLAADREEVTRLSDRARTPKSIAEYVDELLAVYAGLARDKVGRP
jgi:glycosyltransferase involved in cell wall biosynthesis